MAKAEPRGLPDEPLGWRSRDAQFAAAREDFLAAIEEGHDAVGWKREGPEWQAVGAARERRRLLAKEAEPPNRDDLLHRRDNLDPNAVEAAVAWLETDPFSCGGGYLKQKIMCRLCRAPLSPTQVDRLRDLMIRLTTRGPRREFRDAVRLARHLDSAKFRTRLRDLSQRPEQHIAEAAARMLRPCETKGTHGTG